MSSAIERFGHSCSSPANERRAWEYAAALVITPSGVRRRGGARRSRPAGLAIELAVTPRLVEAWRRWWHKRGRTGDRAHRLEPRCAWPGCAGHESRVPGPARQHHAGLPEVSGSWPQARGPPDGERRPMRWTVRVAAIATTTMLATAAANGGPSAASVERQERQQDRARPNVVVVMADDMRADDLRFMPHVRRLVAARGLTYANAFSPYPLCCPARASFLTGQYAHNHHVLDNEAPYGLRRLRRQRHGGHRAAGRGLPDGVRGQVPQRLRAGAVAGDGGALGDVRAGGLGRLARPAPGAVPGRRGHLPLLPPGAEPQRAGGVVRGSLPDHVARPGRARGGARRGRRAAVLHVPLDAGAARRPAPRARRRRLRAAGQRLRGRGSRLRRARRGCAAAPTRWSPAARVSPRRDSPRTTSPTSPDRCRCRR